MTPWRKNPMDLNLLSVDTEYDGNYFNPNFEKLYLYNESY